MKKSFILALLTCAILSVSSFASMTVIMNAPGGNDAAYTATVNGTQSVGIYSAGQTFKTFCLEANEYFNPGLTYNVQISTAAVGGGLSGGNPDPLDTRTAFLYTQFLDNRTAYSSYSEKDFQNAIHYIEGEGGANNGLVTAANQAVSTNGSWYGKGLGDIRVMNLWYLDGTKAQDQLVRVPAPGALLLGSMGIAFVGYLRKKRAL